MYVSHEHSPDVWRMLFEQTPVVLRWVLGILSAGLFTMATYIYRRNQRKMQEIETYIDKKITEVEKKMDAVNASAQLRDEAILRRLEIIDGRVVDVLNTLAGTRRG